MNTNIKEYAKAVVAIVTAALVAVSQLLTADGGLGALTPGDWITVALAALGALGVYLTPNSDGTSNPSDTA